MKGKIVEFGTYDGSKPIRIKGIWLPDANRLLLFNHTCDVGVGTAPGWMMDPERNPDSRVLGDVDVPDALVETALAALAAHQALDKFRETIDQLTGVPPTFEEGPTFIPRKQPKPRRAREGG